MNIQRVVYMELYETCGLIHAGYNINNGYKLQICNVSVQLDIALIWNMFMFYTEIVEADIFAFAYRLFHEDFSPLDCFSLHSSIFMFYFIN